MHVARPQDKALVAVVDQRSIKTVRKAKGSHVSLRSAGLRTIRGRLVGIDPRATDELPSPSLAASEGGPVSVRPATEDGDQGPRMLTPHFQARIELDEVTASHVPAGMRVSAAIGYRSDPIALRLQVELQNLWSQAQRATR